MTDAEKKLLLKDLSGRFPYHPFVQGKTGYTKNEGRLIIVTSSGCYIMTNGGSNIHYYLEDVKPYLRPMSSMTEEEIKEYRNLSDEVVGSYGPYHHEFSVHCVRLGIKPDNPHECVDDFLNMEAIDWLNKKGFDYRGLIPMGLALEAPENMYT